MIEKANNQRITKVSRVFRCICSYTARVGKGIYIAPFFPAPWEPEL
jgi:hypothetical protein